MRSLFCGAALFASLAASVQGAVTFATVDSAGDVGSYSSMQLNASGFPVISYFDDTNGVLKLAVCTDTFCDSFWTVTTVDNTGIVGGYTSLQLNASGFPVISYYDYSNGDLKLAVCNNATCTARTLTTVDSTGFAAGTPLYDSTLQASQSSVTTTLASVS